MATYEEVKDVPNHPEVYLIDVRNKDEVASTGAIPASINIPCKQKKNKNKIKCKEKIGEINAGNNLRKKKKKKNKMK